MVNSGDAPLLASLMSAEDWAVLQYMDRVTSEGQRLRNQEKHARRLLPGDPEAAEKLADRWDYYHGQCCGCGAPAAGWRSTRPGSRHLSAFRPVCLECGRMWGRKPVAAREFGAFVTGLVARRLDQERHPAMYRRRVSLEAMGYRDEIRPGGLSVTAGQLQARYDYYGGRCHICRADLPESYAWDHVKPRAAGGPNIAANLRPACNPCNARKGGAWRGVRPVAGRSWDTLREARRG